MRSVSILALLSAAEAAIQGFNYGATFTNGAAKIQSDFEAEFKRAQTLQGTSGWSSARLYTMIQGGTANTPSTAIPAAINTKTGLLLGLWASAGQDVFNNEVAALKSAIQQYGSSFTDLIQGISIGSEDLYRITPTGIANKAGVGADPDTLVKYIDQVRSAISGTSATGKIGHVDTWTAWTNSSNNAVISAVDWIGFDGYPYFQTVNSNGIDNAANLFRESYDATVAASQGKPVWVTETGWPVSGDLSGQAVASPENAKTYWDQVGCSLFGKTNTWWYTLQDAAPQTPNPSFGIVGTDLNSAPIYDLSCPSIASSASSSAASATTSAGSPSAPASTATMTTADLNTTPVPISGSSLSLVSGTPVSAASSVSGTPVSAASSVSESPMSAVTTITVTTMLPLESCPAVCANSPPALSSATTTMSTALSSATTTMPPAGTASACPTNLNGDYQYPHLIVPVDSTKPNTALGTSYNGTINSNVRSIFNFDIPQSYAGKTCSLVFLFPKLDQLETSSYSFNNKGGLNIAQLSGTASQSTTFSNSPSISNGAFGSIPALQSGNGYVVGTMSCPAGQAVAYEFSSTGGLELNFFEDYNPSPLGAYITVC